MKALTGRGLHVEPRLPSNRRNIYVPKTGRGAGAKANKKKKKTDRRQWASSRKEQPIQQHSDFRRNILREARDKVVIGFRHKKI